MIRHHPAREIIGTILMVLAVLCLVACVVLIFAGPASAQSLETAVAVNSTKIAAMGEMLRGLSGQVERLQWMVASAGGGLAFLQFAFRLNPNWLASRERRR